MARDEPSSHSLPPPSIAKNHTLPNTPSSFCLFSCDLSLGPFSHPHRTSPKHPGWAGGLGAEIFAMLAPFVLSGNSRSSQRRASSLTGSHLGICCHSQTSSLEVLLSCLLSLAYDSARELPPPPSVPVSVPAESFSESLAQGPASLTLTVMTQ